MKLLIVVLSVLVFAQEAAAQSFKLVRSQSGPNGTLVGDKFELSEARSRFVYPQDSSLVVYFEWEGPVGEHVLVGQWRGPDGRVIEISADVRMRTVAREFAAYWQYSLRAGLPNGVWTLEVRIDGEPAGSHSFEVVSPVVPHVRTEPVRPTVEEIYGKVKPSLVWVHKIDSGGRRVDSASGFVWAKDRIATAFQAIDGAGKLEIEFDDGRRVVTEEVAGLHRVQDWAIVCAPTLELKPMELGTPAEPKVGERGLVFNVQGQKVRSIEGVDVNGKQVDKVYGPRMSFSPALGPEVAGGPLLTVHGAVAAVVGGSRSPGSRVPGPAVSSMSGNLLGWHSEAVAVGALAERPVATLSSLLANGSLTPPLVETPELLQGGTVKELPKDPLTGVRTDTVDFSRRDREVIVYTIWRQMGKRSKGVLSGVVCDINNRPAVQIAPVKIKFRREMPARFAATFSPGSLGPAMYRVDLALDGQVCWRGFIRIVD